MFENSSESEEQERLLWNESRASLCRLYICQHHTPSGGGQLHRLSLSGRRILSNKKVKNKIIIKKKKKKKIYRPKKKKVTKKSHKIFLFEKVQANFFPLNSFHVVGDGALPSVK